MDKKILSAGFYYALGAAAYVSLVAWLLANAEVIFGRMAGILAPITFLLLFVVSAAVTGSLVLGKPLMMYLDGEKKDAVKQLAVTIAWLFLFTIAFMLVLVLRHL